MIGTTAERGLLLNGLLAAIRLSAEPMVISDPHQADNPLVAVNPAFEALTQYTEAELSGAQLPLPPGQGHRCRRRAAAIRVFCAAAKAAFSI